MEEVRWGMEEKGAEKTRGEEAMLGQGNGIHVAK